MNIESSQRMELKPILWFIILTFAVTYAIEIWVIAGGLRFDEFVTQSTPTLWLLATMWIPGLAGLFVATAIEKHSFKELIPALSLRMGSIGPYFLVIPIAPLAFGIMYLLTWKLGFSGFDPTMSRLAELGGTEIISDIILQIMLPLSILMGPLINLIFGLGEEIGWRGFLLPRLMPLGKTKAYCILGVLWGLWHAPLIYAGFNYPGYPLAGITMMCLLCIAFGVFLNEMTLHYRSSILAGFIHGAVNAQGYGIWMWLFPDANPLIGGGTGIIAVIVWLAFGYATIKVLSRQNSTQPA